MANKYPRQTANERKARNRNFRGSVPVPANDNRIGVVKLKPVPKLRLRAPRPDPYSIYFQQIENYIGDTLQDEVGVITRPGEIVINEVDWQMTCSTGSGGIYSKLDMTACKPLSDPVPHRSSPPGLPIAPGEATTEGQIGVWAPHPTVAFPNGHSMVQEWAKIGVGAKVLLVETLPVTIPVGQPAPASSPIAQPFAFAQPEWGPQYYTRPNPGEEPSKESEPQPEPETKPKRKGPRPPRPSRTRPVPYTLPTFWPFIKVPVSPVPIVPPSVVVTPQPDGTVDIAPAPPGRDAGPASNASGPRYEVQKKTDVRQVGAAIGLTWAGVNTVTEVFDFVGAMHDSIASPKHRLSDKASKAQVLEYMFSNVEPWRHIDLAEGLQNFINLQVGDAIAAFGSNQIRDVTQQLGTVTGLDRLLRQHQDMLGFGGLPAPELDINQETGAVTVTGPLGVLDLGRWKRPPNVVTVKWKKKR